MEGAALAVISDDSTLQLRYELVLSVLGIGKASAISLLAQLSVLPADMTVRQWVAHAGLAPRHKCSSTSVLGKARVSKTGNTRIRKALFLPALTAVRYVPEIKNRLQQLKTSTKNPLTGLQVVVAIMRKILHAIFGMLRTNSVLILKKSFVLLDPQRSIYGGQVALIQDDLSIKGIMKSQGIPDCFYTTEPWRSRQSASTYPKVH